MGYFGIIIVVVTVFVGRVPCTMSDDHAQPDITTFLPPLAKLLHVSMPPSHTALSGDLHVQISGTWPTRSVRDREDLLLRLSRLDGTVPHVLYKTLVLPDARNVANGTSGATVVRVPCGLFSRGGEYYVEVVRVKGKEGNETGVDEEEEDDDDKVEKGLDVRWPMPRLSITPEHVQTYPESPVTAILEFPEVMCPPVADSAPSAIPEFWLELHYCGHSLLTCDNGNQTHSSSPQVLYSEQIRGFPGKRILTLRCELFGLAGHYALVLRPTTPMPSLSNTAAYVKADWSEQFVFNVHARSIMPCDVHSGGITVLFQYPSCILASGDRVRLYARLRADVASLAPPTSMEYVAEKRVVRGQHALHFECDFFTEKYVEYCFVYVSQAISGAVADVRMDCVPTLPVSESESGGWGAWSAWTACSSTCAGGTRNRYRFCDSPPPRYGAKFCEGAAVETEKCGPSENAASTITDWECLYGNVGSISSGIPGEISPADRPEILAEVGPGCRCGCVVHLGEAKPRRLLATSSHSCPGRTFWLIQADSGYAVRFKVDHFRLPCASQWLKVRDGNSLSATLLAQLSGGGSTGQSAAAAVQSTGCHLLLEFFSDELMAGGEACGGGFLAHAQQIRTLSNTSSMISASAASASVIAAAAAPVTQSVAVGVGLAAGAHLTAVHVAALLLASVVLVATALLGAQYVLRYRKYHIAEDMDSLADSGDSNVSLALRARASSSATLLSEVISLTRLRPPGTARHRHTRLRESMDCGDAEHDVDAEIENLEIERDAGTPSERETHLAQPEDGSLSSTHTLTPPERPETPSEPLKTTSSLKEISSRSPDPSEKDSVHSQPNTTPTPPAIVIGHQRHVQYRRPSAIINGQTLTNGCYSPAGSIISTATIRSTNPKESKEKRNRERLLAGPVGSEFSLAGPDADLELDYYDYNVVNAQAVPGSYLGMDPQYLVWIPPLDDTGEILQNLEKNSVAYEDIRPKQFVDPGSNQESPEEEIILPKERISINDTLKDNQEKVKELSPLLRRVDPSKCAIPLRDFPKRLGLNSPAKVHKPSEKETKFEKSPSSVKSYENLDDIKFADDEDEDSNNSSVSSNVSECNKKPYQDSNIITSNHS